MFILKIIHVALHCAAVLRVHAGVFRRQACMRAQRYLTVSRYAGKFTARGGPLVRYVRIHDEKRRGPGCSLSSSLLGALVLGRVQLSFGVIWFAEDLEFRGMN